MFNTPSYLLWMTAALGAIAFFYLWGQSRRAKIATLFARRETLALLIPSEIAARRKTKFAFQFAGLFMIFIALAGPQWGIVLVPVETSTSQVLVAIDTSLSMLSEDVKPSRLEKAKDDLSQILDGLKATRIGIIAFSGDAGLVCPITTDMDAAKQVVADLRPGIVPLPGTGVGRAIELAQATLAPYSGSKTLILMTDGEDHHTAPLDAAAAAAQNGIKIYAIGLGTPDGAPIPIRDDSGAITGYKKDKKGSTVITRLNEANLVAVAAKTGGGYFRASVSGDEVSGFLRQIEEGGRPGSGWTGTRPVYRNHFMIPLAAAFLLILIGFLIPEHGPLFVIPAKVRIQFLVSSFRGAAALFLLTAAGPSNVRGASDESALRKGNSLYGQEQYVPALENYYQANGINPADGRPVFNAGDALYRLNQYDKASGAFSQIAASTGTPASVRSDAFYNLGNAAFNQQNYAQAVDAYRNALILKPGDPSIVNNLAVALKALKNPPPKKKNQNQQDKNKNQSQQNQQKSQNQKQNQSGRNNQNPNQRPQENSPQSQSQISKEDAQRIMQAVADKEKAPQPVTPQTKSGKIKQQEVEEDW